MGGFVSRSVTSVEMSSSSAYPDPDGIELIEVIDESDIVVFNAENSDSSSFKSAEVDSEINLPEEDLLDVIEEYDFGLVPASGVEDDFAYLEEGEAADAADEVTSSEIARETVNDATIAKTEEGGGSLSREGQESEGASTPPPPGTASGNEQAPFATAMPSGCCSCPGKMTAGRPISRRQSYLFRTPRTWVREESPVPPASEDPSEMADLRTEFLRQSGVCFGCRLHDKSFGDLLSRDPRAFGIEMVSTAHVETPIMHFVLKEIENPGDPEEIVEIVDERGYSRLVSGPIVVLRKYYFGLIRIQEPFDPQWDLDWCREAFYFMAVYEAESMLSSDAEKASAIWRAVDAVKSYWRSVMLALGNGNRKLFDLPC